MIVDDTVKPDNVPTLVMLGCAAVDTVPAVVANATVPDTFAPATAFAVAAIVADVAVAAEPLTEPVIVAVTDSADSVPTEVMLGCAATLTVPAYPVVF